MKQNWEILKEQTEMLTKALGMPSPYDMLGGNVVSDEKTVVEMTEEEYKDYFGAYDKHVEMEENKSKDENL